MEIDIWQPILAHLTDDVRDLLHLSRVSKWHHALVMSSEDAWKAAHDAAFGACGAGGGAAGAGREGWRTRFKARFLESQRAARQLTAARRLKATSAAQVLLQEVFRIERTLRREERTVRALVSELADLARVQQADTSRARDQMYWQPVAVTQAQGARVEQSAPLDAAARAREARQQLGVSRLEVSKLEAALRARRRRLEEAEARVRVLQP